MTVRGRIVGWPNVYRAIQLPFAKAKFAPVRRRNDLGAARRVLDVACGPAINTRYFGDSDYLGIDVNERYIAYARRKHGRDFVAADVTTLREVPGEPYDFILVNGFLHHIPDSDVEALLARLAEELAPDGRIHVVDILRPQRRPLLPRVIQRCDRGSHFRSVDHWRRLLSARFDSEVLETYPILLGWATAATAIYFRGRARDPER